MMQDDRPPVQPDYQSEFPKKTGMALTAMILGIVGVITTPILIGAIMGIVALILGIVSLSAINRDPARYSGRGYAITGITTGISSLALLGVMLLIAILMPSVGKVGGSSNRASCAANIRGILNSEAIYAAANMDSYAIAGPVNNPSAPGTYSLVGSGIPLNTASTTADLATSEWYRSSIPTGNSVGNIPANLWILVLQQGVSPKLFMCKYDAANNGPASTVQPTGTAYYNNFQSDFQYSYSWAYPWIGSGATATVGPWWRNTSDASLPVMSDIAPMNGSGSKPTAETVGLGSGPPRGGSKAWASPNHQRDGQNVGFGDVHVEYQRRPDVGNSSDNIWTTFGSGTDYDHGKAITPGSIGSWAPPTRSPFDIVMVPVADLSHGNARK